MGVGGRACARFREAQSTAWHWAVFPAGRCGPGEQGPQDWGHSCPHGDRATSTAPAGPGDSTADGVPNSRLRLSPCSPRSDGQRMDRWGTRARPPPHPPELRPPDGHLPRSPNAALPPPTPCITSAHSSTAYPSPQPTAGEAPALPPPPASRRQRGLWPPCGTLNPTQSPETTHTIHGLARHLRGVRSRGAADLSPYRARSRRVAGTIRTAPAGAMQGAVLTLGPPGRQGGCRGLPEQAAAPSPPVT